MRKVIKIAMITHFIFSGVCLYFKVSSSFLMNMILAFWSYSLYLTLKEWQLFLYLIAMIGSIAAEFLIAILTFI